VSTTAVPALHLRGLRKVFGTAADPVVAVDGIDLDVGAGEIVAFLGPNGAGKTTTLDMVLGLTRPTAGTVQVLGGTPRAAVDAGRVAAVLQAGGLLRDLTVGETVAVIAALHHVQHRAGEVMERTGIAPLARRKVRACSGGEQQRLRFALALLPDPQLLVLDEPTAGMDVAARHEFWATMREEVAGGRTVLFATHYLEEAQAFAPRTVLIGRGRLLADGPTEQLRTLVGTRAVSATLPDDTVGVDALGSIPGVDGVRLAGHRVTVTGTASDEVARVLLVDLGAHDLEITSPTLESAFLALTREDQG